jgi:hypothetical protein
VGNYGIAEQEYYVQGKEKKIGPLFGALLGCSPDFLANVLRINVNILAQTNQNLSINKDNFEFT